MATEVQVRIRRNDGEGLGRRPWAYTREEVRVYLCEYQRFAMRARPPSRDDVLGSKPPPANEAPWTRSATLRADIERALKSLPLDDVLITFMHLAQGGSSWRYDTKAISWREKVGDWWGMTAGEVNATTDRTLETVVRVLNGGHQPEPTDPERIRRA